MFAADIELTKRIHVQHRCEGPIVDAGGLVNPCIADYQRTIDAMRALRELEPVQWYPKQLENAQKARYLNIERPFSFLGDYEIENPETGGKRIEELEPAKYGTVLCFSVLEHVPFVGPVVFALRRALKTGGLLLLSAPWQFPYHDRVDYWRFSPDTLRLLFNGPEWEILEYGWHLQIAADAGVLDIKTGKPQAVEASFIVARAI